MSNLTDALIAAKLVGGSGGSGGGSGLPEITDGDKGKVLTVIETSPTSVMFIPEQTLTAGKKVELVGVVEPELFYHGMKGTIHISTSEQSGERKAGLYYSPDGWYVATSLDASPFAYLDEGKWYIPNIPAEVTISMTLNVPQISSYTEVFSSQSVEVVDGEGVLQMESRSWFQEDAILRITINNHPYYSGVVSYSGGGNSAAIPFGATDGTAFEEYGDTSMSIHSDDGTYAITIEVCNSPLICNWAFRQSGSAGITPNGEINIISNGATYGATIDVYGIFAHHKSGDIEYVQGKQTFDGGIVMNDYYALAVPTVGEGETEHIDCYFSIASFNYGTSNLISASSNMKTFDRMRNQNNAITNVWHCVSANGVKMGQISVQFAVN